VAREIHRRRDADPKEGIEKYGDTAFADSVKRRSGPSTLGCVVLPGLEALRCQTRTSSWR
jgi:hypothetical protein